MIRWTPPTQNSPPAPQGWRPRADISKSNVALSSDDPELAILRSQLLAMRREVREIQEALTAMRLERERLVFNRAFAALRFKAAAIRFEELRRKGASIKISRAFLLAVPMAGSGRAVKQVLR